MTLEKDEYVWSVTCLGEDGHRHVVEYFLRMNDADEYVKDCRGIVSDAKVCQTSLWKSKDGDGEYHWFKFMYDQPVEVFPDKSKYRKSGLAKLSWHEKNALGLLTQKS